MSGCVGVLRMHDPESLAREHVALGFCPLMLEGHSGWSRGHRGGFFKIPDFSQDSQWVAVEREVFTQIHLYFEIGNGLTQHCLLINISF